jgi:hypothetical protein
MISSLVHAGMMGLHLIFWYIGQIILQPVDLHISDATIVFGTAIGYGGKDT